MRGQGGRAWSGWRRRWGQAATERKSWKERLLYTALARQTTPLLLRNPPPCWGRDQWLAFVKLSQVILTDRASYQALVMHLRSFYKWQVMHLLPLNFPSVLCKVLVWVSQLGGFSDFRQNVPVDRGELTHFVSVATFENIRNMFQFLTEVSWHVLHFVSVATFQNIWGKTCWIQD